MDSKRRNSAPKSLNKK